MAHGERKKNDENTVTDVPASLQRIDSQRLVNSQLIRNSCYITTLD
jgi:hypothetical protein